MKHCCELFEVSRAAYYERKKDAPSAREVADAELTEKIIAVHTESKGTYGSPRVHQELVKRGVPCGRRRVRRLMHRAGLEGRCKKRWRKTTVPDPAAERAKDLMQRHFGPCTELDRRYVGDITYIMTWEGWSYLATVIDLASRRVVGWALADHMRTELVEDALKMAFVTRRPDKGVIFHSGRGLRRAPTLSPRARCCIDRLSPPSTRAWTTASWPGRTVSSSRSGWPVNGAILTTQNVPPRTGLNSDLSIAILPAGEAFLVDQELRSVLVNRWIEA